MTPSEQLLRVLEDIRENQRRQIANFERALQAQEETAVVRRYGNRLMLFLIFAPWLLVVMLLAVALIQGYELL